MWGTTLKLFGHRPGRLAVAERPVQGLISWFAAIGPRVTSSGSELRLLIELSGVKRRIDPQPVLQRHRLGG